MVSLILIKSVNIMTIGIYENENAYFKEYEYYDDWLCLASDGSLHLVNSKYIAKVL